MNLFSQYILRKDAASPPPPPKLWYLLGCNVWHPKIHKCSLVNYIYIYSIKNFENYMVWNCCIKSRICLRIRKVLHKHIQIHHQEAFHSVVQATEFKFSDRWEEPNSPDTNVKQFRKKTSLTRFTAQAMEPSTGKQTWLYRCDRTNRHAFH
jgi:hypothetical protein